MLHLYGRRGNSGFKWAHCNCSMLTLIGWVIAVRPCVHMILASGLGGRRKVVEAGYLCNRSLSYILAKFDKFKPQAAKIYQNGNAIYDKCIVDASNM
ncbi:hypothetical protein Dimus_011042 [Dionaea muscipula]